jgi:hypothetical protein
MQTKGRRSMRSTSMLLGLAAVIFAAACSSQNPDSLENPQGQNSSSNNSNSSDNNSSSNATPTGGTVEPTPEKTILDERVVDYSSALRTASLKIVQALPTLQQIMDVANAADKKAAYEAELDKMLDDPRFTRRMIKWWKDTMRQGGGGNGDVPSRDTAPTFAARVMLEGRSYAELFTAESGTCPTYDADANAFVDGDCNNNVPTHAGVLTNPGVQYQFYGNMAFRRDRWVQEIFVCTKFPAEYADKPVQMGGSEYVSPWDFMSIGNDPINFQDTSSVLCANCHTSLNHIAPLFANFDMNGMWTDQIQVMTPTTPDAVKTEIGHWLRSGEVTSWRLGTPTPDLPALGKAIAADPDVAECAVARMWNFAMSKEDIVSDLATVPIDVLTPYIEEFGDNGMNLKQVLRSMFASEDFVRF